MFEDAPWFIQIIYDSAIATHVRESEIVFPILQTFHALGIMLMVGTIATVDLRVLGGILKSVPVRTVEKNLLPLTWAGFVIMAVSGGVLLAAQSARIYQNDFLIAKLLLLVAAGLNVLFFHFVTRRALLAQPVGIDGLTLDEVYPLKARLSALLSLTLWTAIVITGRFIAYY